MEQQPRVIVEPLVAGGRRVRVGAEIVGVAYEPADVIEFLRRAGLDDADLSDTDLIDWHGGGPYTWA